MAQPPGRARSDMLQPGHPPVFFRLVIYFCNHIDISIYVYGCIHICVCMHKSIYIYICISIYSLSGNALYRFVVVRTHRFLFAIVKRSAKEKIANFGRSSLWPRARSLHLPLPLLGCNARFYLVMYLSLVFFHLQCKSLQAAMLANNFIVGDVRWVCGVEVRCWKRTGWVWE